jgi:poly(3-hydroxybutyrate) depolymerase
MTESQRTQRVMQSLKFLAALWLAGLGVNTARAQFTTKTVIYKGLTRTWFQHIPASYNGSHPVPLVLALHGYNNSGDQFAVASGWMPVSDAGGFIVVFPNGGGTVDKNFGWQAFAFAGEAPDDAGFLLALIDEMKQDYPIDATRVYMTGFSNGGGMASTFALMHPGVLAGVAPVSGGWRENIRQFTSMAKPDVPIPVWIWRGGAEDVDGGPLAQAQMDQNQLFFWVEYDGDKSPPQFYRQPPYTTSIYRGGQAEVRYTSIEGADHNYQPGTAQKIWDGFFSVFSRQGKAIVYHRPK